jgi:hypothetical protein
MLKTILLLLTTLLAACTTIQFEEETEDTMNAPNTHSTEQNFGNQATIFGSNPGDSRKLLRVPGSHGTPESAAQWPWLVALSAKLTDDANTAQLGPVLVGNFGVGGASHNFECDAKPDSVIALPGVSLDLNVQWDFRYVLNLTTNRLDKVQSVVDLPTQAIVKATAKHGYPSSPNATRSINVSASNGGAPVNYKLQTPAFSNSYMLYIASDDEATAYSNITRIRFNNLSFQVTSITGTELLAIRNAGQTFPIPGLVDNITVFVATNPGDAGQVVHSFGLNL